MWHYNESEKNILGQNLKKEKHHGLDNNVYYIDNNKKKNSLIKELYVRPSVFLVMLCFKIGTVVMAHRP